MAPNTLPVTLVCGVDADAARAAARHLLFDDPSRALVTHSPDGLALGLVARTIERGDGAVEPVVIELAHGCPSCTLREDALPTLVRLAEDGRTSHVVLLLPPALEPAGIIDAFHSVVLPTCGTTAAERSHVECVVAVVTGNLIRRLDARERLADVAIGVGAADDRTVGEVLARQAESADVVVATGADPTAVGLLRLLNPGAWVLRTVPTEPDHLTGMFDLGRTRDRADTSLIPDGQPVRRVAHAWRQVWRARRPLHPVRIEEAIPAIVGSTIRTRGSVWLASRPDARVGWESTGPRLILGQVGTWIGDGGASAWSAAEPAHRARAQLEWDPVYGDRFQELSLAGVGEPPQDLLALLDSCLLTAEELEAGPLGPPLRHDPLADVFRPDRSPEPAPVAMRREAGEREEVSGRRRSGSRRHPGPDRP